MLQEDVPPLSYCLNSQMILHTLGIHLTEKEGYVDSPCCPELHSILSCPDLDKEVYRVAVNI